MVQKWRGQEADLELSNGDLPADPIGVLQEVTVTPDRETSELRGTGDTKFQDVMETARAFEVSGTVLAWDAETWDHTIEWDEAAEETDSSSEVERFTADVTLEDSDGGTKEIGFVEGYFDPMPEISGGREDWIGMEINLRFPDVDSITNTDPA